ncbi:kinesin family protein, partial [Aureobasidium melanogenum]
DNLTCTVEVSYLEIYNERVRDLLNPSTKGNLKVREHPSTGPYVEDLAKLVVRSFAEIEHLMDEGNKARTVAATNMNETSSRSHAVFTLTLSQKRHDADTGMDTEKAAKISLVDLAGSERAQSTGATGARLKEGAEINRSLSTLGRVIAALADLSSAKPGVKKKNASMVPYRDSVLTWLLKDSLGGNSMTAMIAAISPADINFEETLSTLRYADSAKRIKNHAVVNEDANARMIRELKEELAQLRSKLTTGGGAGEAGAIASEQYPPDTPLEKQMVSITQADGTVKQVSKAEIVEQLDQSEKLYQDLNQTWEQKLQKTELIHKEREAALEELGISIEKGFVGLSTPKKMPHLVNLSDDPLLAECLVYNLKPGTTTVGNVETAKTAEIRLNGSKILHEHCTFENEDDVVTVVPRDNAAVMVNGQRVDQPKRLRSGYRIILGDFHIFRFNHPQEARAERAEEGSRLKHSITADEIGDPSSPSPSVSHGHDRSWSNVSRLNPDYDLDSRANSPMPMRSLSGRENDYDLARREAVSSMLGSDQKISALTDDELDNLFDDLQKVRAVRRGRPESRLFDLNEDDSDSVSSFPVREKYLSNGTLENFSLDTALTMPSTP